MSTAASSPWLAIPFLHLASWPQSATLAEHEAASRPLAPPRQALEAAGLAARPSGGPVAEAARRPLTAAAGPLVVALASATLIPGDTGRASAFVVATPRKLQADELVTVRLFKDNTPSPPTNTRSMPPLLQLQPLSPDHISLSLSRKIAVAVHPLVLGISPSQISIHRQEPRVDNPCLSHHH
ncbi:hypothetical protein ZWY2020_033135 [Hordeum vulgare]|nr:hypothetical protein ZWY2020_033135 [Hordeum vulgare]